MKHVKQAIRSGIKTSVASSWHFISTYYMTMHGQNHIKFTGLDVERRLFLIYFNQ